MPGPNPEPGPEPATWASVMSRPRPTEPARARRDARDALEAPWSPGRITFPATHTSHPTPTTGGTTGKDSPA